MTARMRASGASAFRRGPVGRVTFDAVTLDIFPRRFDGLNVLRRRAFAERQHGFFFAVVNLENGEQLGYLQEIADTLCKSR